MGKLTMQMFSVLEVVALCAISFICGAWAIVEAIK